MLVQLSNFYLFVWVYRMIWFMIVTLIMTPLYFLFLFLFPFCLPNYKILYLLLSLYCKITSIEKNNSDIFYLIGIYCYVYLENSFFNFICFWKKKFSSRKYESHLTQFFMLNNMLLVTIMVFNSSVLHLFFLQSYTPTHIISQLYYLHFVKMAILDFNKATALWKYYYSI